MAQLEDPEDEKLVTLARSTRARADAAAGAAVRDSDGRTYAAATVDLASLQISALRLAVAMAASSGADRLEAAAVVTGSEVDDADLAPVRDLGGTGLPVFLANEAGEVATTLAT